MKTPGFNAEASLYKTSGRYQATMYGIAPTTGIVAAGTCFDACVKCDVDSVYPIPGRATYCKICRACNPPWLPVREPWGPRGGGPWAG
jgi:hypothetical protein